jgi:hypothetical protein
MKSRKKTKNRKEKPFSSEIDVAYEYLMDLGYISNVMDFNKWFLRPVIESYSENMRYKYGKDLLEHLRRISKMKGESYVPEGVSDPIRVLSCILERTCYRKMSSGSDALSIKVDSLKKQYKDLSGTDYDDSQDASDIEMIENLEKMVAAAFVEKFKHGSPNG